VIRVVAPGDSDYPTRLLDRLGDAAPALHVAGPIALTEQPLLGVVGSRDVDDVGARIAASVGGAAVARGWGVVSGGAAGVDLAAMDAALAAGGTVVGFPADPLLGDWERMAMRDRLCLATPYGPYEAYSPERAHARNKLIYAAARITVVVATEWGGTSTWLGATEAIEHEYGAVAVWTGAGAWPGNAALVDRGATPVTALDQLFD